MMREYEGGVEIDCWKPASYLLECSVDDIGHLSVRQVGHDASRRVSMLVLSQKMATIDEESKSDDFEPFCQHMKNFASIMKNCDYS